MHAISSLKYAEKRPLVAVNNFLSSFRIVWSSPRSEMSHIYERIKDRKFNISKKYISDNVTYVRYIQKKI